MSLDLRYFVPGFQPLKEAYRSVLSLPLHLEGLVVSEVCTGVVGSIPMLTIQGCTITEFT